MGHCGDRVAALMDGELSDEGRERILRHLAGCPDCRAEAEALRRVKAVVFGLTESAPAPPPSLLSGLLSIAERPPADQAPPAHPPRRPHTASGPGGAAAMAAAPLGGPRQGGTVLTVGAFSLVALVFGAVMVLAVLPSDSGNTQITPPFEHLLIEHAVGTGGGGGSTNAVVDGLRATAAPAPAAPTALTTPTGGTSGALDGVLAIEPSHGRSVSLPANTPRVAGTEGR